LASHDLLLLALHGGSHSVWIHLALVAFHELMHAETGKALLLADRAVLVGEEKGLEIDNFIP
jgi:hypothetical protein